MPPLQTPICDFNKSAFDFKLKSTENKLISLNDIKGSKGTLIMFICNHCPYVKAIIKDLVDDCNKLKKLELMQLLFLPMIQQIILKIHLKI